MSDNDTLPPPAPLPRGLFVYLDSHDVREIDIAIGAGHPSETIGKLQLAGAVGALPLVESVEGLRQPVERVVRVVNALRLAGMSSILFSFPSILADVGRAVAHLRSCRDATRTRTQWDIEPKKLAGRVVHWAQDGVDELLDADPDASITSTRIELPRFDVHGREVWLQLEQQTSTATLQRALELAPDAVCVTGVFDQENDPRTLDEIRADLERCTAQARRVGRHGVWSAHTLSPAEARLHRAWGEQTFA